MFSRSDHLVRRSLTSLAHFAALFVLLVLATLLVTPGVAAADSLAPATHSQMRNTSPFPVTPALTAIAIGYSNVEYIADEALPRVPVDLEQFKYTQFPIDEAFTIPDTRVGRRGRPTTIDMSGTEVVAATEDFGLDDAIPQNDIDTGAARGYDTVGKAVERITDLVMLDREVRASNLLFNSANYAGTQKVTLAGTSQFSDFVNSDPIGTIMAGLDACLVRPNTFTFGQATWSKFRQHPKVVAAVLGNAGNSGIVSREAVASLFEVKTILVGRGYLNTAKRGQAATLARVWGKHLTMTYIDPLADSKGGLTFGFTAQYGSKVAGQKDDPDIGLRGGVRVRSGESVKELIVAPLAGYMIENAVA